MSGRDNFGNISSKFDRKQMQVEALVIQIGITGNFALISASARPSGHASSKVSKDQRTHAYRNLMKYEHQRTGPNWDELHTTATADFTEKGAINWQRCCLLGNEYRKW